MGRSMARNYYGDGLNNINRTLVNCTNFNNDILTGGDNEGKTCEYCFTDNLDEIQLNDVVARYWSIGTLEGLCCLLSLIAESGDTRELQFASDELQIIF